MFNSLIMGLGLPFKRFKMSLSLLSCTDFSKYVHFQLSPIHPFSKLFELFILFFVHLRNFLMFVVVS